MAGLRPVEGVTGAYVIEATGEVIQLNEWKVWAFYDSVQFASGLVAAGTQAFLFRDVQNKNLQHNNFQNNAGRLPAHTRLITNNIGVIVAQAIGATLVTDSDFIQLAYGATLEIKINDQRKIAEGPVYAYPSGYGVSGTTTRSNTGVVTTGIASAAAAPQLLVAQPISDEDSILGQITFYANTWLIASSGGSSSNQPNFVSNPVVTCRLEGLVKRPGNL